MKNNHNLTFRTALLMFLLFFLFACSNQGSQTSITRELESILKQKEYFKLREYFSYRRSSLPRRSQLYYYAFIANAFNNIAGSKTAIDTLEREYSHTLSVDEQVALWTLRDNSIKIFNYNAALLSDLTLLNYYHKVADTAQEKDARNFYNTYHALANIPPEQVVVLEDDTFNWKRNTIGIMEIAVRFKNSTYSFVFDTRASISVISRSFAKKVGLKILNASYDEFNGITGARISAGIGIADSLYIDNILVRNAVFQILPDQALNFPQLRFSIAGAIGFPIIKELREIHIFQNGKMQVSTHPSKSKLNNLAFDASTTVLSLQTELDTLSFHFDLGAGSSTLYHHVFERYKQRILKTAKIKYIELGGAGGITKRKVYEIPHFIIYFNNQKITLDSLDVLTRPIYKGQKYYGNIGQDLIGKFFEMTLNFESMYVDFK
jgi:hypothetical protein